MAAFQIPVPPSMTSGVAGGYSSHSINMNSSNQYPVPAGRLVNDSGSADTPTAAYVSRFFLAS